MAKIIKKEDINTFEKACEYLKLDAKKVIPNFSFYPEKDRASLEAHAKIMIITDAINRIENDGKEWFPNWEDTNEYKYEIWFDMESSASGGFSYYDCDNWLAGSSVGSRLCFKNRELAKYTGTQFKELYEAYFVKK